MENTQALVGVGGLGLVAVNFWTSSQRQTLGGVLFTGADPGGAHAALLTLAGELVLVGVLVLLASASDELGRGALAIVGSLWLLWAIGYYTTAPKAPANAGAGNKPAHP